MKKQARSPARPSVPEENRTEEQVPTVPTEADVESQEVDDLTAAEVFDSDEQYVNPAREVAEIPDWVTIPPDLKMPPNRKIGFMRFKSEWTDAPTKGVELIDPETGEKCLYRVLIMWTLSLTEEQFAYGRSRGEQMRAIGELSKMTIRAIDGRKVDATASGKGPSATALWQELGTACRQIVQNYYLKTHTLSIEQQMHFFGDCFAVRSGVVG